MARDRNQRLTGKVWTLIVAVVAVVVIGYTCASIAKVGWTKGNGSANSKNMSIWW